MKFMFKKNKEELVRVDLKEYERLEKSKIDMDLRFLEEKKNLELEQKQFELLRKLETVNDIAIMDSRSKFLEAKNKLNEEILLLKKDAQELEIKNKLEISRDRLKDDYVDQTVKLKNNEIELLKSNHTEALKDKNEIIELLKTQVEVLTAKLTEIKISDAHIHVESAVAKK